MLFEHLQNIANTAPANSGLRAGDVSISYEQMAKFVERLASGFLALGIERGQKVAILLPNGPDFFMVTYALASVGAIAVPVNEMSGEAELEWLRDKCEFGTIICADNFIDLASKLLHPHLQNMPQIISISVQTGMAPTIKQLQNTAPTQLPVIGPDVVASYLLSSGSTGRPKLVPHTHGQLIACAKIASTSLKLSPQDTILNALPAHHAFGFLNGCFEVMTAGASTFYWADPGPLMLSRKKFLDLLKTEKISVMPGVPYIFQTLSEVRKPVHLPDLRLVYSSGIALKRGIYDAFNQQFGLKIHQGYGCTETGMISLNGAGEQHSPWDCVGPPSPGVCVKIIQDENQEQGIGELFVTTPARIDGYVHGSKEENAAFVDGGYLTGDLGRFDELGNIYITGRTKLIIEVAGEKVDPFEVEDVLCLLPEILEAVVIGIPDPSTGEQRLKAFIVRDADIKVDQIISFCRGKLMAFKVPQIVEFIEKIPKSAVGKVQRGKLM